jgi:hypothetical protein
VCEDFSLVFASLIKVSVRSNRRASETNARFKKDDGNVYGREHTNLIGNPNHYTCIYTQRNYSNGFESFNFIPVTFSEILEVNKYSVHSNAVFFCNFRIVNMFAQREKKIVNGIFIMYMKPLMETCFLLQKT